jgi:hypothetical protein
MKQNMFCTDLLDIGKNLTKRWSGVKGILSPFYYLSVVSLSVDDFESYLQTVEDATGSFGPWEALARFAGKAGLLSGGLRRPMRVAPHCDEPH